MLYPKDFVSTMLEKLKENSKFSVATCKIKQWDYKNNKKTNKIDSFGMGIRKYHHFYDIGQGEEDNGQYNKLKEIFGVSGALAVFTKKALSSIRYENEYFDKNIHYKNDVDLSYRLQWTGNRALLVHNVTVYHDRQVAKKSEKSMLVRKSSFFGEQILMKKNFYENYPLEIKLKTKSYHLIKNFYLLTQVPTIFQEIRKLRELKEEIEKKTQAVNKNEIAMKRILELMT
jgi:GT2 family glycosyltransferase